MMPVRDPHITAAQPQSNVNDGDEVSTGNAVTGWLSFLR
jgi:hypothetical protein